jgi:hypothetical protein
MSWRAALLLASGLVVSGCQHLEADEAKDDARLMALATDYASQHDISLNGMVGGVSRSKFQWKVSFIRAEDADCKNCIGIMAREFGLDSAHRRIVSTWIAQ